MTEAQWLNKANKLLLNRKIVQVRYLSEKEMEGLGWSYRCIVFQLDDGNLIFPSADDEGNEAGVMFTNDESLTIIPVMG